MKSERRLFGLPARSGRWIFVAAGFLVNLCMGTVFGWSVFRKPIEAFFGVGATASILPFITFSVFFSVFMVLAGRFIGRFPPGRIAVFGSLVIGAGWLLSSLATNIVVLTVTYGAIAGAGIGIVYGCPLAVSSRWFPEKKGLAVGLTLSGFGLSALVTAPLCQVCIGAFGPIKTFGVLGAGFLLIVPFLCGLLRFPSAGHSDPGSFSGESSVQTPVDLGPARILRKPAFYGLWACFLVGIFTGLMAIGIASPAGQEIVGITPVVATAFISVFAAFNGLGRALFGWLVDRITPRYAAMLSFAVIALCSAGMLNAGSGDTVLYGSCFAGFWLCLGGWFAMAPASTLRFFGTRHYSANYGLVFTANAIGSVAGNLLAGRFRDILGSYIYAFWPTLALAGAGLVTAFFLMKPPDQQGTAAEKSRSRLRADSPAD